MSNAESEVLTQRTSWRETYNAVLVDALKTRSLEAAVERAIDVANRSEAILAGRTEATAETRAAEIRDAEHEKAMLEAELLALRRLRALIDTLFVVREGATEIECAGSVAAHSKMCEVLNMLLTSASGPFKNRLIELTHGPYPFMFI